MFWSHHSKDVVQFVNLYFQEKVSYTRTLACCGTSTCCLVKAFSRVATQSNSSQLKF